MENTFLELRQQLGWIAFYIIILIPIILSMIYIMFTFGQNYKTQEIIKKAKNKMYRQPHKKKNCFVKKEKTVEICMKKSFVDMLLISLRKVNGWNIITAIYACLYYALNFWSVVFSVLGVILISEQYDKSLALICAIFTAVLFCLTLFLKVDKKWMIFKRVLSESRIATNKLIYELELCAKPNKIITIYTNKIVRLEDTLTEGDLL